MHDDRGHPAIAPRELLRQPVPLGGPGHRAGITFLRAGLLALLTLLVPSRFGGAVRDVAWLAPVTEILRFVVPLAGFAVAGAISGAALHAGRRVVVGYAVGFSAAGLVLSAAWPQLSGLTGREDPTAVVAFAVAAWALAFGVAGTIGARAQGLGRGGLLRTTGGFAAGGALGGLLLVAPSLLQHVGFASWPALAQLGVTLLASLGAVLVPFGIGGAVAGRETDRA